MNLYELLPDTDEHGNDRWDCLGLFGEWTPEFRRLFWERGRKADRWAPFKVFFWRGEHPGDFFHPTIGHPVVSERALEVLMPLLGGRMEPLPLEWVPVVGPGRTPIPPPAEPVRLSMLNVLDVVPFSADAVVRRNKETGAVITVTRYTFRPEEAEGKHLFLPEGRWLGPCLVSEDFKRLTQRQGLRNAKFRQIEW
jgi:hypothetical protein